MSDEPYEPFDQEARLPPPPWSPDDPALKAWEAAHGHDVRVKCYVEFGCQVIEESLEREIDRLESQNQALQEESDRWRLIAAENEAEFRRLGTQNQALQEALREIANNTLLSHKEITDLADAALSPT